MNHVTAALGALAMIPAVARAESICTVGNANDVIATIAENSHEVPVLRMNEAGNFPAVLLASPDGNFTLLVLTPTGQACVLAIGTGLAVAPPGYRLPAQVTQ